MQKSRNGFTLIEILVVLGIVGVLLAVLSVSFTEARQQARDKVRMTALKEIELSIELYKAQNGRYPQMGCGAPNGSGGHAWSGAGPHSAAWGYSCDEYILGLVPDFIAELPKDPNLEQVDNTGYIYTTNTLGTAYKLLAHYTVEALTVTSFDNEFARCPAVTANCNPLPQSNVYAVYSLGAETW